jgi:hypothetical protein
VHGQLDRAGQPQPPRRFGHRPGEDGAGGACPREAIVQYIHATIVSQTITLGIDLSV